MKCIIYHGSWAPVAGGVVAYLIHRVFSEVDDGIGKAILTGICIGFIFQLYIWSMNQMKVKNGKPIEKLTFLDAFDLYDRYAIDTGKWAAMHPAVDERLLYDEPEGYVLGKNKDGKYVCASFDAPGASNVFLVGGSGTGKTSAAGIIASALVANNPNKAKKTNFFILDPKGEIHSKTASPGDGTYHIAPGDRTSWGYDPFFLLNDSSTEQEILDTSEVIAISLIPRVKGENDPIWTNSSRALIGACIIYGWTKKGFRNLAEIINWILSGTAQEIIAEIVENSSQTSAAYKNVIAFYGDRAPDDMVGSIFGTLFSKIKTLATNQDLQYCIGYNPRKFNPSMLLEGSCYLNIPADKLTQYAEFTALILNQIMLYINGLPDISDEPTRPRIQVIIDEASALLEASRLDYLCDFLRLERSKGCMSVLAVQSYSGLLCAYDTHEAQDIISNCPFKLFLDATTPETQELITKMVGKFKARIASFSGYGSTRKRTITFQDEEIITTADMARLGSSKEMILVSSIGGFSMIQKAPYWKDKMLKRIAKEIQKLQKEE